MLVQDQAQSDLRPIISFLFAFAMLGLLRPKSSAFKIGVGQVIENDGLRKPQQLFGIGSQEVFDPVFMGKQEIRRLIERIFPDS